MAKKTRVSRTGASSADGGIVTVAETVGQGLGHFLNQVENQWKSAKAQRDGVIQNLKAIRDKANQLLAEAGEAVPVPAALRRGTRGTPKASGSAASKARRGAGKGKKGGISAEGRARIAEAQRARWAKLKASRKSSER